LLSIKNLGDLELLKKKVLNYCENNFKNSKNIIKMFEDYKKILISENLNMNLIGKSTIDNFDERHLLDCMQIHKFIDHLDRYIADLGSGAGLPGVILAILGFKNVILIEKSPKKALFLNKCKLRLGLNFDVHNTQIEDMKDISFDVIVARALAPVSKIIKLSIQITNNYTNFILLKGKSYASELAEIDNKKYSWQTYPSITSDEARIISINSR